MVSEFVPYPVYTTFVISLLPEDTDTVSFAAVILVQFVESLFTCQINSIFEGYV